MKVRSFFAVYKIWAAICTSKDNTDPRPWFSYFFSPNSSLEPPKSPINSNAKAGPQRSETQAGEQTK